MQSSRLRCVTQQSSVRDCEAWKACRVHAQHCQAENEIDFIPGQHLLCKNVHSPSGLTADNTASRTRVSTSGCRQKGASKKSPTAERVCEKPFTDVTSPRRTPRPREAPRHLTLTKAYSRDRRRGRANVDGPRREPITSQHDRRFRQGCPSPSTPSRHPGPGTGMITACRGHCCSGCGGELDRFWRLQKGRCLLSWLEDEAWCHLPAV
jgi:hypothetical protein